MAKAAKRDSSPTKLFSQKNGRAASKQSLMPGQKTTTTPGDPVDRMMGHYGKDGSPSLLPDNGGGVGSAPIRNAGGGIRDRPRSGGLQASFQRAPEVPF